MTGRNLKPVSMPQAADIAQYVLLLCGRARSWEWLCADWLLDAKTQQLHDRLSSPAPQHVAQCEVLPRGDGPSPDERVGTQLRLGYQAPGLQNGSTPVADLVRLEHATAAAAPGNVPAVPAASALAGMLCAMPVKEQ